MSVEFFPDSHVYLKDGKHIRSVTQILLDLGFVDTTWFTEQGRNRGSAVHIAVKHHASHASCMQLSDEVKPYVNAYRKFEIEMDWVPLIIEEPMANDSFSGTPDQIGMMNGFRSILDVKTGAIDRVTGLQLAGYVILDEQCVQSVMLSVPVKRFALQLTKEGKYKLTEYRDRGDRYIFQSAVAIWHWKRNNLK